MTAAAQSWCLVISLYTVYFLSKKLRSYEGGMMWRDGRLSAFHCQPVAMAAVEVWLPCHPPYLGIGLDRAGYARHVRLAKQMGQRESLPWGAAAGESKQRGTKQIRQTTETQ